MRRFPDLAEMFSLRDESDIPEDIPPHLTAPIEILPSKQGVPTARDGGKFLHSAYNPAREGEQSAKAAKSSVPDCRACAFFSFGLGYAALSYANFFPSDTLILVEKDPRYFFTALSLVDWTPIFSLRNCIIALGTGIDFVVSLIERSGGLKYTAISENLSQSAHESEYFSSLHALINRNKKKIEINASTLEKFSALWLKNTCKNLHFLSELEGISIFKDACPEDLPVIILAAGPSLEEILPNLAEFKERAVLVAVDTALRACLRAGVEPDFIVLADPQYYAYRHIAGLSSPSSILITESAAYPAVFRFECRKILLCSSFFPLGQCIESKIGSKGRLVAGGSVATTAWEFARFIGAREIFCAGLDLGFPHLQTHIKGSTFEENIHKNSGRILPAEEQGVSLLFAAGMENGIDYNGEKILTDSKMKMFAWWFESKSEEFKGTLQSYSLSPISLKIPNFKVSSKDAFLSAPKKSGQKERFFKSAEEKSAVFSENRRNLQKEFDAALQNLKAGLSDLALTAQKGMSLAEEGMKSSNPQKFFSELQEIDRKILRSEYKEIASLVFPSEKKLASLFEKLPPLNDEIKSSLRKSKIIYQELAGSISLYKKYLGPERI